MSSMFTKTLFFSFLLLLKFKAIFPIEDDFTSNGFSGAGLRLDGIASITSNGLLQLTNAKQTMGHAFLPKPLRFRSQAGNILSFSSTFVFAILSEIPTISVHGMAFVISPTVNLSTAIGNAYLGVFNLNNNGNTADHIFAVELDTLQNPEFDDIDDNHVGIDINSLNSTSSYTAGYYEDGTGLFKNLTLMSGQPMQLWIDFHAEEMLLDVTLSPLRVARPKRPLLSSTIDLSRVMLDSMYIGFSAATGSFRTAHCVLGWSFKLNGTAKALDYDKLPLLPITKLAKGGSSVLAIWLPIVSTSIVLLAAGAILLLVRRRMKYAEIVEDWELQYGPQRFSYKDLFQATKGFKDNQLLGSGGFGSVYRGSLPIPKMEVAVKKVSHESRQGMKSFVAEIVSLGQIRHRNLVQLLGYCRRRGELLLVYDFMPNGSLDRFLHDNTMPALNWAQRLRIIKGVASGLLYLHEDWEQVVIHRDIKASNVLLDGDFNGRLGDFGLARLYDHGTDPLTTHVVGTMGYIAPELARTGKATTATDVFGFGVFLLEVVCGRRPVKPHGATEELILIDWVLESWQRGSLIATRDPRLGEDYCTTEVELALKLGLLCSSPLPAVRPSTRQVMQILEGDIELPELLPSRLSIDIMSLPGYSIGFDDYITSFSSSTLVHSSLYVSGGR